MENKIASYYRKHVTLAGIEKREEVLDLFDKIVQTFPNWGIMTCPVMHQNIPYTSPNFPLVLGHDRSIVDNIQNYFKQVHPDDQEDLQQCLCYLHQQVEMIPQEEQQLYRTVIHYRIKKKNGQCIYLHDEKAVLHLPGSGNLYYALIKDVTGEKIFNGVKAETFKNDQMLRKIREYKPSSNRNTLSRREGELVVLIKQGLSTKEIAWHLQISHNTVRNIKSKLFEKYNVNNTIELLNMVA